MDKSPTQGKPSISPPAVQAGAHALRAKRGRVKTVRGFLVLLLALFAFAVFFALNFRTVVVSGQSMEPTFHSGQRVLVSQAYWLVGSIKHKDIVVIREEGGRGYMIKRVFKTGGEEVDWANAPESHDISSGPYRVPEGHLYVLGDNRSHSEDSRRYGPVALSRILGKVIVRP